MWTGARKGCGRMATRTRPPSYHLPKQVLVQMLRGISPRRMDARERSQDPSQALHTKNAPLVRAAAAHDREPECPPRGCPVYCLQAGDFSFGHPQLVVAAAGGCTGDEILALALASEFNLSHKSKAAQVIRIPRSAHERKNSCKRALALKFRKSSLGISRNATSSKNARSNSR